MQSFLALVFLIAAFVALVECNSLPTRINYKNRTPQYLRKRVDNRGRIVGGDPADIADFPHQLVLLDLSMGGFICGASAIHRFWATSAAHCLEFQTPASAINLRGGSSNRLSGGFIFFAESYTLHPQYDPSWLDFDIALIHIQEISPLEGLNVHPVLISPICFEKCCQTCEAEPVIITGWGWDNTAYPIYLNQISLPIYNHDACDSIWTGIGDFFFCVQAFNGRDSCSGDSGSPLVRDVDGVRFQLGVVSFGSNTCGDGSGPSVNTRIEYAPIRSWINSVSGL